MRKTSIVVWAFVLASAAIAGSQDKEAPSKAPTLDRLAGSYTYAGTPAEDEQAIDAQIETAIQSMGGFVRKKARRKLEQVNSIPKLVRIGAKESDVTVGLDDFQVTAPTDGTKVPITTPAGEPAHVFFHLQSASLVQEIDQTRATRKNTFRFRGEKLVMTVEETSSRLDAPVKYDLVYAPKR